MRIRLALVSAVLATLLPGLARTAAAATGAEAAKPSATSAAPNASVKPQITLRADADLARQKLTVTENGKVIGVWSISSGVEDHSTPHGTFHPEWTDKMHYSHTYDNAPMPYAVFFKGGAAIHGTNATGALGRAASHGCVRLSQSNAQSFYNLVQRHGMAHTLISVTGTPDYSHAVALASSSHRNASAGAYYGGYGYRATAPQSVFASSPFDVGSLFGPPAQPRRVQLIRYR